MAKAKTITGIDCGSLAIDAIGPVLATRLEEMCALRARALDSTDPEGVHDMRVSSRRLRGALSDFAPYLSKRGLNDAVKEITILADALGEVRDQDVAILGLEKLAAQAPGEATVTLKDSIRARVAIRNRARRDLQKLLRQTALKQLQINFAEQVNAVIEKSKLRMTKSKKTHHGNVLYGEMAHRIVFDRLKELERLSDAFYHPLKTKPLHKMRIAAKHLRYALELFEQCLGPGTALFARKIAALQTSLGELHDCDVWIETFGRQLKIATREAEKNRVTGSLWLLGHFVRLHSKHLRSALSHWEEWEATDSGNQLRKLIEDNSPKLPPEPTEPSVLPAASA
ncbi:MAG TPA: CHAD domain-containing protein [Pyrinomonadaceae bacterium]